jgi:hypothetical protein
MGELGILLSIFTDLYLSLKGIKDLPALFRNK